MATMIDGLLNEVLSLNAQEFDVDRVGLLSHLVLNEVLSLNAQEWEPVTEKRDERRSSMKS